MDSVEKTESEPNTQAPISPDDRLGNPPDGSGGCCGLAGWVPWAVLGLALLIRLAWLGLKPPHFDEGVNGWFIDQMAKNGYYHYDPQNYHGPFHFYVLFLAQTLLGRDVIALRLPIVLINVITLWLIFQFRRFIPWRTCLLTALAFAVSPGMIFYSRYGIHEAWLLFGLLLSFWGFAELWRRGSQQGLWSVVMGITLMMLTKETYLMHLVAFGLAVATLFALERFSPSETSEGPVPRAWKRRTLFDALLVAVLLLLFFFSGGLLDRESPSVLFQNFFQAFSIWSKTGVTGHGHEKPFYYWLQLFGRYEWPAVIGLLYGVRALFPGMNRLLRLLAIYGCGTLAAYSIVPYKTPWCIISIIWPFFFLFGAAMDAFIQWAGQAFPRWGKSAAAFAAALLLTASLAAAVRLNRFHPADPREPYVYVQTMNDFFKLKRPLDQLLARDPAAAHMTVNVLLSSYHPLPWVLGDFTSVGYYDKGKEPPSVIDAGIIVAEEERVASVEAALRQRYFVEDFQLRDAMPGGKLYLNYDRFAPLFPGRPPEFVPSAKPEPTPPAPSPAP